MTSPALTSFGKRILIAVPHPDDEVVGFCSTIARARAQGATVYAIYLTNGCIARETLWPWQRNRYEANVIRRLQESVEVARALHITPVNYADRPARRLWSDMTSVYHEITKVLDFYKIDQLWVPAFEGGNADHDGLNGLCARLKDKVSILEFAEYNFAGNTSQAQTFPFPNGTEVTLTLSEEEVLFKKQMLAMYKSEQQNLGYVGTHHECYRPLARYDYSKPPHEGTLWYARFQWVPFRHPRVDFTKPEHVCWAISAFSPPTNAPLESAMQ